MTGKCVACVGAVLAVVIMIAVTIITVKACIDLQHDEQTLQRLSQQAQQQLQGVGNYFNS
jgi:hypothetical protein